MEAADGKSEEDHNDRGRSHDGGGELDHPVGELLEALFVDPLHDGQCVSAHTQVSNAPKEGSDQALPDEDVDYSCSESSPRAALPLPNMTPAQVKMDE